MLFISKQGHVDAERVIVKIFPSIERGPMEKVNGIVVHQTGGTTTSSTFNSYSNNTHIPNGAHFLIDKDGTIYQTASLSRVTNHVGKLQSRCIRTLKCSPTDLQAARRAYKAGPTAFHRHESQKTFPDRYPSNSDSIGIELVGMYYMDEKTGEPVYESATDEQNASLRWLIRELSETLDVQMSEVYRHPEVGRKNATEASTARWE
ncbi:N-acetylmuramoyl-L-alanine amidase [Burkholderia ubonensis]|uniref:peptidoglycan recognition protein family protein n=1 Tax=Burkholderia ubonensis TaxID=101571 RepID=UPI0007572ECC|nr:N-acetylmuramoyl-L-alanine amidase [Burkholderia ubonensis]KUZ85564.1 N-acetylmuramoyl-L-alanine amidase [Burkholderia ubonensis]KVC66911.1 N-acetylmuramoyl-L-alanine amidase [Burkholderia ubonensis]KVD95385.1 N-acetylmuramoyl-L-alanine amidase [Burkholderia ubonensis]